MNHLLALEKVVELIGNIAEDYIIASWKQRVRQSDEPSEVINNLRKALKASNDFDQWSNSLGNFVSSLSWSRNFSSTHLLLWGHLPGKLKEEKKVFQEEYDELIARLQKASDERMREKDRRDVALFS